jgi:hypothetical protein
VPQRYRKAQDQYQGLILEIEMAERTFIDLETANGTGGTKLPDPHVEKEKLQKLYDTARADQQANYPDLYVSTGATTAKVNTELEHAKVEAVKVNTEFEHAKVAAVKVQNDLLARIEVLAQKLEVKFEDRVKGLVDDVPKK